MTPEELKERFPLAFDTIKLPVRYYRVYGIHYQSIVDDRDRNITVLFPTNEKGQYDERKNQIGELIAELLNQLQ